MICNVWNYYLKRGKINKDPRKTATYKIHWLSIQKNYKDFYFNTPILSIILTRLR